MRSALIRPFVILSPRFINAAPPNRSSPSMVRAQTFLFAAAGVFALLALGLIGYLTTQAPLQRPGAQNELASVGGPFALTDQDGRVRSDKDFRGRFMLLYFGYSSCPDVCPTTLQNMANAISGLGSKTARIVPAFITVDPERDTPAVLKKYIGAFGPRFVGLTGSRADIAHVAHAYRVYFAKSPVPGGGYSVDHSGEIYLLGPDGRLVTVYDATASAAALAADLRTRV
jgi:protein SCO1/2